MSLKDLRTRYDRLQQVAQTIGDDIVANERRLQQLSRDKEELKSARAIINDAQDSLVSSVEVDLNYLVNAAIRDIFPDRADRFSATFRGQSDKLVLDLEMMRNDRPIPIVGGRGGGLVNTVEVALRFVALSLSNSRSTLVLDQPFSDLSEDRHKVCGEFISQLCDILEIQLLSVSHQSEFREAADMVVELELDRDEITRIAGQAIEREALI